MLLRRYIRIETVFFFAFCLLILRDFCDFSRAHRCQIWSDGMCQRPLIHQPVPWRILSAIRIQWPFFFLLLLLLHVFFSEIRFWNNWNCSSIGWRWLIGWKRIGTKPPALTLGSEKWLGKDGKSQREKRRKTAPVYRCWFNASVQIPVKKYHPPGKKKNEIIFFLNFPKW